MFLSSLWLLEMSNFFRPLQSKMLEVLRNTLLSASVSRLLSLTFCFSDYILRMDFDLRVAEQKASAVKSVFFWMQFVSSWNLSKTIRVLTDLQWPEDSRTSGALCTTTRLKPSTAWTERQTTRADPKFPVKYVSQHKNTTQPRLSGGNGRTIRLLLCRPGQGWRSPGLQLRHPHNRLFSDGDRWRGGGRDAVLPSRWWSAGFQSRHGQVSHPIRCPATIHSSHGLISPNIPVDFQQQQRRIEYIKVSTIS